MGLAGAECDFVFPSGYLRGRRKSRNLSAGRPAFYSEVKEALEL